MNVQMNVTPELAATVAKFLKERGHGHRGVVGYAIRRFLELSLTPAFSSTEEALEWLEAEGFSTKQHLQRGGGRGALSAAALQNFAAEERASTAADARRERMTALLQGIMEGTATPEEISEYQALERETHHE